MTALSPIPTSSAPAHSAETPWWVGAALGLTVVAFSGSWLRFPSVWMASRSHGFAVAALCVWLIWRDRTVLAQCSTPYRPALLVLLGLSLTWFVGVVISAQVVHLGVLPLLLLSWLLAVCGEPSTRVATPIAATFSLALPIWEVLIWPLQQLTVLVNSAALRAVGLEAEIRGTTISIPSGTLVVADSCAGLNFLMTGVTVSVAYSLLFTERWSTRAQLIATAALISLVANWVRVFGLVVIAHATNMQSSLMQDHSTYGWIIFLIALLVFFWLAPRLERRAERWPQSVAASASGAPRATDRSTRIPGAVIAATCAAVSGPLLFVLLSLIPRSTTIPPRVAGIAPNVAWTAVSTERSSPIPWSPAYDGASETRILQTGSPADVVQLNRLMYRSQGQGSELISASNRIAADSLMVEDRFIGPLDQQLRIVRQAVVREPSGLRMVWYWYRVAGIDTPSRNKAKLLEVPAFVGRTPASELIAVSWLRSARYSVL